MDVANPVRWSRTHAEQVPGGGEPREVAAHLGVGAVTVRVVVCGRDGGEPSVRREHDDQVVDRGRGGDGVAQVVAVPGSASLGDRGHQSRLSPADGPSYHTLPVCTTGESTDVNGPNRPPEL